MLGSGLLVGCAPGVPFKVGHYPTKVAHYLILVLPQFEPQDWCLQSSASFSNVTGVT